jgi:ABC-type transport system, involved in lipoprotein release, permease component
MYIVKNAWKSIARSKGRNILIGIIVLVIATSSVVALAIRSSANEVVRQQKAAFNITATIGVDRSAIISKSSGSTDMRTIMSSIPALTLTQLKSYADSAYVTGLAYQISLSLDSSDITAASNSSASSGSASNSRGGNFGGEYGGQQQNQGDFRLIGYSSTSAMSEFESGAYKISSGAMFGDSDTGDDCVITDELAKANSLKVGSTITLVNPSDSAQSAAFKVVGIYTDTSSSDGSQMNFFSNAANQIITNYTAANKIVTASAANSSTKLTSSLSSTFTLKDAASFDKFKAELKAKGLNQYYTATSNLDSFDQSVEPLTNLSNFATIFLILVLLIGGIILIVLNMFNIRERKYEVGVLRAIGMKKGKVALQFIVELFIVTFIFLSIGTVAGSAASVPVANSMLQTQISSVQSQQSQVAANFGNRGGSGQSGNARGLSGSFGLSGNVSYIRQINAVINGSVILQIIGIGILLTILSSLISMIFISRYEPLKILSSRT